MSRVSVSEVAPAYRSRAYLGVFRSRRASTSSSGRRRSLGV